MTDLAKSAADPALASPEGTSPAPPAFSLRKPLLLAALVLVLLGVAYFSPLRDYLGRLQDISQQIRNAGFLAPLVVVSGVAVLVAVGLPRLLFCVIAGMALGFWSGLLWAQLGTLLGNYALFLLVRSVGQDWSRRYLSRHGGLGQLLQREGLPAVILARQIPVPGLVINVALALSPLRHRHFLLGTALGQLPEAVPCTLIGAGALQQSFLKSVGLIGVAVAVLIVLWLALRRVLARPGSC